MRKKLLTIQNLDQGNSHFVQAEPSSTLAAPQAPNIPELEPPVRGQLADYEAVSHPIHYNAHPLGIEAIDVIEWNPYSNLANVMKYCWRVSWGGKFDDLEDLEKMVWYGQREIARRKSLTPTHP